MRQWVTVALTHALQTKTLPLNIRRKGSEVKFRNGKKGDLNYHSKSSKPSLETSIANAVQLRRQEKQY